MRARALVCSCALKPHIAVLSAPKSAVAEITKRSCHVCFIPDNGHWAEHPRRAESENCDDDFHDLSGDKIVNVTSPTE